MLSLTPLKLPLPKSRLIGEYNAFSPDKFADEGIFAKLSFAKLSFAKLSFGVGAACSRCGRGGGGNGRGDGRGGSFL